MSSIKLDEEEIFEITGYANATKQLQVLHRRGFHRAFINRLGSVVLERAHYEAVTRGEAPATVTSRKSANLAFLKRAA